MERLRVALDATPLLGQPTGVGAFVAGVLPVLAADPGLEVSAFTLSRRGGAALAEGMPDGVRLVHRPGPAAALLRVWSRSDLPPGEWWTGRADVVHGTNFTVPPARHSARVVTVHDLTPLRFPELALPATRVFPAVLSRAVQRGAWVHTPSTFVAGEVVELLHADPDRVRTVHHGVPAQAEPEGDRGWSPPEGPYVLAIGTVEPRKGFPSLIQAFDALAPARPGLRLVIAGADGWGVPALEAAVERAVHGERVLRLGYVSRTRRAALLRSAAAFAFPSLYEGFGLPPLEAMVAGVPVVATTGGALPEILGDGAVLVAPDDHEALAEALALVLDDESFRKALVARGRSHAGGFSWERCGAGLSALYRGAAGERD